MRKLSAVTNNESRVVLMFNAVSKSLWLKVIEPFGLYGFYPVAIYWVLGEAPSGVTASRLRGMFLIVFKKGKENGKIHVVYEEPLDVVSSIVSLDRKWKLGLLQVLGMLWEKFTPGQFNAGRVLGIECHWFVPLWVWVYL